MAHLHSHICGHAHVDAHEHEHTHLHAHIHITVSQKPQLFKCWVGLKREHIDSEKTQGISPCLYTFLIPRYLGFLSVPCGEVLTDLLSVDKSRHLYWKLTVSREHGIAKWMSCNSLKSVATCMKGSEDVLSTKPSSPTPQGLWLHIRLSRLPIDALSPVTHPFIIKSHMPIMMGHLYRQFHWGLNRIGNTALGTLWGCFLRSTPGMGKPALDEGGTISWARLRPSAPSKEKAIGRWSFVALCSLPEDLAKPFRLHSCQDIITAMAGCAFKT